MVVTSWETARSFVGFDPLSAVSETVGRLAGLEREMDEIGKELAQHTAEAGAELAQEHGFEARAQAAEGTPGYSGAVAVGATDRHKWKGRPVVGLLGLRVWVGALVVAVMAAVAAPAHAAEWPTAAAIGASSEPAISADGPYVAFVSEAWNLVSGDSNEAAGGCCAGSGRVAVAPNVWSRA